jgi:hypothetical protein
MRPLVEETGILSSVYARGRAGVHLTHFDWDENIRAARTLCGHPVRSNARSINFLVAGCLRCAERASGAGIHLVTDGSSGVNLVRFIEQRRSHPH